MSQYTTGEVASLCGITVRTVQYYDKRGILMPSEISEGGRRLYSEDDVNRLRTICFLRDIGIGIKEIGKFLDDPNSIEVISLILEEQKKRVVSEAREKEAQLKKIEELQKGLRNSTRLNDCGFDFHYGIFPVELVIIFLITFGLGILHVKLHNARQQK